MADTHSVEAAPSTPNKGTEPLPTTPLAQLKNFHIESLSKGTPMGSSSHGPEAGFKTVQEEAVILEAELHGHIHLDADFAKKAFLGKVPDEERIRRFLKECDLYDNVNERWKDIPEVAQRENVLYGPFCDIFNAVVDHFGYSATRTVVDTHKTMMNHVSGNGNPEETHQLKTAPDLTIKGSGNNYSSKPFDFRRKSADSGAERVDYLRTTSPHEVKTETNRNFHANLIQIAVYARQCFIQQHNRRAVYSLIMTEKSVVLYMFDRSGVNHSVEVDIHKDAATFVRFILGVVSPDEQVVGFDTSIYWKGEDRYLKTVDAEGKEVTYKLARTYPVFYRRTIRSRGTFCWEAFDPVTKKMVLIKDSWRASLRRPETDYLKVVKELDLEGVVQMISCQADEDDTTAKMRGIDTMTLDENVKSFRSRTFSRIVFVNGGYSVERFKSRKELLFAFRDAIVGHLNLWKAGILHRDVSMYNILIGRSNSLGGYRGVIIDLDLAIFVLRKSSCWGADFRTGTRAFQSVNVLSSYGTKGKDPASHDHLDDLESFYYVLFWICHAYLGPKLKVDPVPDSLLFWEDENPLRAAHAKISLFSVKQDFNGLVTDYFGPVFRNLLSKLTTFFQPHVLRKAGPPPKEGWPTVEQFYSDAEKDYKIVIGFFNEAIAELEREENANTTAAALFPPSPATPAACLRSPLSPIFPPQSRAHRNSFNDGSPLRQAISSEPASPTRKRKSDSEDEGSPRPKKSRDSSKLPLRPPLSPSASTRRSRTMRSSNLHISESYGDGDD